MKRILKKKNEGGNDLNDNEEIEENEENDNNDENNDNGVSINNIIEINNLNENEKNDEIKLKIKENNINLKRPIFLKTKIDKGTSKKFNVFKLNTNC